MMGLLRFLRDLIFGQPDPSWEHGVVGWYSTMKHYGYIRCGRRLPSAQSGKPNALTDGGDVFFNRDTILANTPWIPQEGDPVDFRVTRESRDYRVRVARNVGLARGGN